MIFSDKGRCETSVPLTCRMRFSFTINGLSTTTSWQSCRSWWADTWLCRLYRTSILVMMRDQMWHPAVIMIFVLIFVMIVATTRRFLVVWILLTEVRISLSTSHDLLLWFFVQHLWPHCTRTSHSYASVTDCIALTVLFCIYDLPITCIDVSLLKNGRGQLFCSDFNIYLNLNDE